MKIAENWIKSNGLTLKGDNSQRPGAKLVERKRPGRSYNNKICDQDLICYWPGQSCLGIG
jgi:hypothetical protein